LDDQWIGSRAPGKKRRKVSQRTLERYETLLNTHTAGSGSRPLQQLQRPRLNKIYSDMAAAQSYITPNATSMSTLYSVPVWATAHAKGLLVVNPMARVEQIRPEVFDPEVDELIGEGLTDTELAK